MKWKLLLKCEKPFFYIPVTEPEYDVIHTIFIAELHIQGKNDDLYLQMRDKIHVNQ